MDILKKLQGFDTGSVKDIDDDFKQTLLKNSPTKRWEVEDYLPREPQPIVKVPKNKKKIKAFVVSDQTVFIALDDLLPECSFHTRQTRTPRMTCVVEPLKCGHGCVGALLNRLGSIAKVKDSWGLYVLYWRLYLTKDKNKDKRAALIVWADTSQMTVMMIDRWQLDYFLNRGKLGDGEVSEEFMIEIDFGFSKV